MKKWLPWIIPGIFAAWVLTTLWPRPEKSPFDLADFGRLPVVFNGRVQPLDSVARNSLLILRTKQTALLDNGESMSANAWLLELMAKPEVADTRKVFRIDHPELLDMLGFPRDRKYFSFDEFKDKDIQKLETEAKRIDKIDSANRTAFERQTARLASSLMLYFRLKNTLRPVDSDAFMAAYYQAAKTAGAADADSFSGEIDAYKKVMAPAIAAVEKEQSGAAMQDVNVALLSHFFERYKVMAELDPPLAVPPLDPVHRREDWATVGQSLLESLRARQIHPAVQYYAAMVDAYRHSAPAQFNQALDSYRGWLAQEKLGKEVRKGRDEFFFNAFAPFYSSIVIYLAAFLLACFSWFNLSAWMNRAAFRLLALAFLVHTSGLALRMYLEGRPPVTNLYSSAIFVGWGAVALGMALERIYRDGIGTVAAAIIGFLTLIIAHNLSLGGDTMEMLRAVLDTNFWLATHVVVITLGYASVFVSGILAIIYITRGFFTRSLTPNVAQSLTRMVYGIVCFSTLFSFVGTVLGGIWADQSWGRFWGWDPKENGALIIVLWCALILHARWGGMIRERGLINMAVFGNIVTSYSWFGVNMLGVGLHSYGFMDKAFKWLVAFIISQIALIGIGLLPARYWKSFRHRIPAGKPAAPAAKPMPKPVGVS